MTWVVVLLCLWQVRGVLSGSYCYDPDNLFNIEKYCVYGCCYDQDDRCCDYAVPVGSIVGIVIGCLIFLAMIVGCVICLCCMCRKQQRSRGQVLQNQSQVVLSQSTVQTNSMPYGYPYPGAQATYPQNPPPYSPPAYPPPQQHPIPDTQPKTLPPTNSSAPPMPFS